MYGKMLYIWICEVIMIINVLLDSMSGKEITPLFIGRQRCESAHSFGPFVREYYLIHFCLGGEGVLFNKQGEHKVRAGQLFIIRPDEITTYTADTANPWDYVWVAFSGNGASCFDNCASVCDIPGDLGERLAECVNDEINTGEGVLSILYELIYRLFRLGREDKGEDRIRKIRRYIKYNYMLPITVEGLAREFGFERSYLYRLFRERYGKGVKEYLLSVRMQMADRFLEEGYTVKECAKLVGYEDAFNFSKAFKKYHGVSPSGVRRGAN